MEVRLQLTTPRWCQLDSRWVVAIPSENVLIVVGEHVVVEVFDSSFAQHCMSRVMGAVLLSPDTAEDGVLRQRGSLARAVLLAQQKLGSLESVRRCNEISMREVREYPPELTFLVWALRGRASLCITSREV